MIYSRDNICEIHSIHKIEADSAEEAAARFKDSMGKAVSAAFSSNQFPEYIDVLEMDYLPEIWSDKLHFFSDDGHEYDASGKEIPLFDETSDEESPYQFIWGVKSWDDLTDGPACEYSMNDIDITFMDGQYVLSLEEIYEFQTEEDRIAYFEKLADIFKAWLISEKGYDPEILDNMSKASFLSEYYPTAVMSEVVTLRSSTLDDLYRKLNLFIVAYKAVAKACRYMKQNADN